MSMSIIFNLALKSEQEQLCKKAQQGLLTSVNVCVSVYVLGANHSTFICLGISHLLKLIFSFLFFSFSFINKLQNLIRSLKVQQYSSRLIPAPGHSSLPWRLYVTRMQTQITLQSFPWPEPVGNFFRTNHTVFSDIWSHMTIHRRDEFEALFCLNNFIGKTTKHIDPTLSHQCKHLNQGLFFLLCSVAKGFNYLMIWAR